MASREVVEAFLSSMSEPLEKGRFTFVPRAKNLEGLAELGITVAQAEAFVAGLTVNNYSWGPEDDADRPGEEVWVFGKSIDKTMAYIKLKVEDGRNGPLVKCLSFHPSDPNKRALQFPLRP
jgi:hypothetical protein